MRRAGAAAGAFLFAAAALVGGRGCSASTPSSVASDATVAPPADSYIPWDGKGPACVPPPRPAGVPDGWELYPDYDPCCGFYIPGASAPMPTPITWESCGSNAVPSGIACQRMKFDWTYPPGTPPIAYATMGTKIGSNVLLKFTRLVGDYDYDVVANADGPILNSLLETQWKRCALGLQDLSGDRYVAGVLENNQSVPSGFLSGKTDRSLADVVTHLSIPGGHGFRVGQVGILDVSEGHVFHLYPAKDFKNSITLWSDAQDNGLAQVGPFFYGDDLFWNATSLDDAKVHIWTEAGGVKDFISFPDFSRTASSLGTDGTDMVWLEGVPRTTDGSFLPASIMTAPYTTNPTQITKRRLRSEAGNVGVSNFVVGCGYAARDLYGQTRLVRVADGQSWLLGSNPTSSNLWDWMTPLVITCAEMFAYVTADGQPNIARVRLDSLGPGVPPD